jgi:hypothetical protein
VDFYKSNNAGWPVPATREVYSSFSFKRQLKLLVRLTALGRPRTMC